MARVYKIDYEGKTYWFTGDQCGDKDIAASKVPGCRPGYNCKVSARFTGDVPAKQYIAQQKAAAPAATEQPTVTTSGGTTTVRTPVVSATGTASIGGTTTATTGGTTTSTSIPPGAPAPAQGYNWDEWREYELYLQVLNTEGGGFLPVPKNIGDYFDNKQSWEQQAERGKLPSIPRTSDESFWIEGQLNIARQILSPNNPWLTDKGEPIDFDEEGNPIELGEGDKEPPPGFETYDEYLAWLKRGREYSEWSMQQAEYRAQEGYRETPQYQPPFQQWIQGQADFSGALQAFTEREYPSLKSEFQATQPLLTGYPTREEARGEAARRTQSWQGWLSGMTPEIEQRYYAQRPAERGERLWMQQPTMRTVNW